MTIPILINTYRNIVVIMPSVNRRPNWLWMKKLITYPYAIITMKRIITDNPPISPNSSASIVKIKSVCFSGRKFKRLWEPLRNPLPNKPPDPKAIFD